MDESKKEAVEKYFNMVYKLALSQTKSIHNAEDVVQNVFLKFLQCKKTFNDREHEKAWLIRVTLNESKSFFTSSWFKKTVPLEENEITFENEEKSDVYYATLRLTPKYRAVIHLFYYEDMQVKEIADALGERESAIKTRLFRGREMLRQYLKGGYEDV